MPYDTQRAKEQAYYRDGVSFLRFKSQNSKGIVEQKKKKKRILPTLRADNTKKWERFGFCHGIPIQSVCVHQFILYDFGYDEDGPHFFAENLHIFPSDLTPKTN